MDTNQYYELACNLAIDAADNHLDSARGIWHLDREDLLCIYDNHPYETDLAARPRQNLRIARRVRGLGIHVLAEAHDGREQSTTILLDCSWDRIPEVHRIICEEVDETLRELHSDF